jgi:glycosyltransferase involved in cell wall biosynthesis
VQEIMTEWPTISIITVSLNGKKWLKQLFGSILDSNYPGNKLEIIFVDNGSTDGSVEFVKDMFTDDSRLKIIQNT